MKMLVFVLIAAAISVLGVGKFFASGTEGDLVTTGATTPADNKIRKVKELVNQNKNKKSPQQIRDEEFVRMAGERNFDELVESLDHFDGDNYAIADATSLTSGLDPSVNLRAILADRRVARLHELLSQMAPEEASEKLHDEFKSKFEQFKGKWAEAIKFENGTILDSERHGLSALLFLVFEFCPESQFDEDCRSWLDWYYELQGANVNFTRRACPQPLLVINLHALALIRRGESIQQINARVANLCEEVECGPLPELKMLPFYKWDDTTRDKSDAIKMIPGFYNWGKARKIWGVMRNAESYRTEAVSKSLDWLEPPGTMQTWIIETVKSTANWFKNTFDREK